MAERPLSTFQNDLDLYDSLRKREERAYAFIYATYPSFRHWILVNNGTEMDAEDAFQKGLLSFFLNIETGKYQVQVGTRITTVVFDYCKKVWFTELGSARLRKHGVMPISIDLVDTTDIHQDLEQIENTSLIRGALSQLKDECRKVIEWFYIEELSLREIAERLGMKESSVKSKRYDCMEKLKNFFLVTAKR